MTKTTKMNKRLKIVMTIRMAIWTMDGSDDKDYENVKDKDENIQC